MIHNLRAVPASSLQGHTFRSGSGIVGAFASYNFDCPKEGHIELTINGKQAGNYTPEAMDFEGRRSVHVFLPVLPNGDHSVEVSLISTSGNVVATAGSRFAVDDSLPPPSSQAPMLLEPHSSSCLDAGVCSSDADCSGNGECASGACVCRGNSGGDRCEIDLIRVTSYLPEVHPARSPSLCASSFRWGALSRRLHARLSDSNSLQKCSDNDSIMWLQMPRHGFGGDVHTLTVALTHATWQNMSLGLIGTWGYGAHRGCGGRPGLGCYFIPHGQCQHLYAETREEADAQEVRSQVQDTSDLKLPRRVAKKSIVLHFP